MDEQKSEAEVDGAAAERMEELVEQREEESVADLVDQLDLDNAEPEDAALAERIKSGTVTETDLIAKARTELYKKLDAPELGVRDLATIYVTGLRVEEARLKVRLKGRSDPEAGAGVKDLREKAAKAMRGGGNDDE